jgi:NTE family protein
MSLPSRQITLALSGGNALGAYAAGACEALHESGFRLDLITGASMGAITAALVAGNPPEQRIDRLHEFWDQAAFGSAWGMAPPDGRARDVYNKLHAIQSVVTGRLGMFVPRGTGFLSLLPGTLPDLGLFDAAPLVSTLERLIDFDRLNAAELPVVLAAVDLLDGEAVYFDSRQQRIEPRHLLASTAFIPGFPPVEIDGRLLGDPGLLCNLPLDPLLKGPLKQDQLCFAVDLFDARGPRPSSIDTALERAQDIAFASQTLRTLEACRREQRLRHLMGRLVERGRPQAAAGGRRESVDRDAWDAIEPESSRVQLEVALIAYRPPANELGAKTLEFSRASIRQRWDCGREDMRSAIGRVREGRATSRDPGFTFYDARVASEGVASSP